MANKKSYKLAYNQSDTGPDGGIYTIASFNMSDCGLSDPFSTIAPVYGQFPAVRYARHPAISSAIGGWRQPYSTALSQPLIAATTAQAVTLAATSSATGASARVNTSAVSAAAIPAASAATVTGMDTQIQVAIGSDLVTSLYGITGVGERIGVISDSFNNNGGESTDVTNGALPSSVDVLHDQAAGGTDEGRAMTEIAYSVAPGAQYDFYNGGGETTSFATAVSALQAAGCTIIVDDLTVSGEMFYQIGSAADAAITTAVGSGVDFFTSAANNGTDYIESGFTPVTTTIAGVGTVTANSFVGGPLLRVTIGQGQAVDGVLGWAQPAASYGAGGPGAQNSLAVYLLNSSGVVVASATDNEVGGDPYQSFDFINNTASTSFSVVVAQNGGAVPAGELFKFLWYNDVGVINNADAGIGSGTLQGHEFLPGLNSVAAAYYGTTPAEGNATALIETFSSVGPGDIIYDAEGNIFPRPTVSNEPQFAAPDGTTIASAGSPEFASQPFFGTSAAAPASAATAALMLQANSSLTTTQITALLEQSVTPTTPASPGTYNGAGLIQARAAVELASASGQDLWTNGSGGNWNDATWSTGAAPTSAQAAYIDDDLGAISGAYTVTVNTGGDAAGAIALAASAGSSAAFDIASSGSLAVGGSTASDRTANDFLVSDGGTLNIAGGILSVVRSLNVNNGVADIASGSVKAGDYAQDAGLLILGSSGGTAGMTLTDSIGFAISGGTASILGGSTVNTTVVTNSGTITDAGTILDSGTLTIGGATTNVSGFTVSTSAATTAGLLSVLAGGTVATALLSDAGTIVNAGTIIDTGALANGTPGGGSLAGTIDLNTGGMLDIGGVTSFTNIVFSGPAVLELASSSNLFADLSGFKAGGDVVDFTGLAFSAADSFNYVANASGLTGDLDVFDSSGTEIADLSYATADDYSNASFKLTHDVANHLEVTATCYCPGTMIGTDRGEVVIERLRIGDTVMTHSGAVRCIRWIGYRRIDVARHIAPEKVRPIRIRANAFDDASPKRDLLVSPDHALFVNGMLIPARLLVNGASIVREADCRHVTYFHLELDSHDILLADGLPAESYLDTGNRAMFENADLAVTLHPELTNDQARRAAESCAPFADEPDVLEPIWRVLALRATDLGLAVPSGPGTTDEPALSVSVNGRRLAAVSATNGRYVFALPSVSGEVRLRSRAAVPNQVAPWVKDDRCLGVLVRRLSVRSGDEVSAIPLDHPAFGEGWWQPEWHGPTALRRWTNGDAVVPFTGIALGPCLLEVDVADTMSYPLPAAKPEQDDGKNAAARTAA